MGWGKQRALRQTLAVAVGYLAVSLPFSMTYFLGRGRTAGPESGYLFLMGLMFREAGIAGCLLGYLLMTGILMMMGSRPVSGGWTGILRILWISCCPAVLWYCRRFCFRKPSQAELRTGRDFVKYLLLAVLVSVGVGIGGCLDAGFCFFWCVGMGIPVMILMTCILGVEVRCPEEFCLPWDMDLPVPASTDSISMINDRIEELGMKKRMPTRMMFRLMACLEEVMLRILAKGSVTGEIHVFIRIRETMMVTMQYTGIKYNPLQPEREEGQEELIGLTIIRQMSLRVNYRRWGNKNEVKILL